MNNFESIDDFLTNRLGAPEKAAFEKELETNTALKAEVGLQKLAIEGVKKARAAELKAMLNNLPLGTNISMEWSALKIAAGIVGAGILIAGLTFYFKSNQALNPTNFSSSIEDSLNQPDNTTNAPEETPSQPNQENISPAEEPKKEAAKEKAEKKETEKKASNHSAEAVKPKIEMVDPTQELAENSTAEKNTAGENKKALVSVSYILVETDATNKKYGFHYQFSQGKLHLYGNFDKGLYEILEVNGDSHTVFMYYKELYYLLDEKQLAITLLEPIKDKKLLSKLKEYRGR